MTGDLLEEYRDTIVPALGARADRWYIRQVSWYVLRAVDALGAADRRHLLVRLVFDALVPVTYTPRRRHPRSAVS